MTQISRLASADSQLRAVYGIPEIPESSNGWHLLLRVLLLGAASVPSVPLLNDAIESPAFADPKATAETSAGELVELLAKIPRGPQKASLLRSVANWWLTNFGNECNPEWSTGLEQYRQSLRAIRGLGPATVDELLLFAAGLPVFPLDRGTLRVAIRHGWLDLPVEDEESQDFFVRGLRESTIDSREFSLLIARVAEQYCGREPKCDGCPLQSLLPPNGPLNPESC